MKTYDNLIYYLAMVHIIFLIVLVPLLPSGCDGKIKIKDKDYVLWKQRDLYVLMGFLAYETLIFAQILF